VVEEHQRTDTVAAPGTVCIFRQNFTLEDAIGSDTLLQAEDAIGSDTCSLETSMRATNAIPLGSPLLLPVGTVNFVQTLKVRRIRRHWGWCGDDLRKQVSHVTLL
jgi:hypothetical protein